MENGRSKDIFVPFVICECHVRMCPNIVSVICPELKNAKRNIRPAGSVVT